MSPRVAARLAWGIAAVSCSAAVAALVLALLSGPDARPASEGPISDILLAGAAAAILATIGALVAARHPRNPIGWISCIVPLSTALVLLTDEYAIYAVLAQPGSLPGGRIVAWLGEWIWVPTTLMTFVLLLFPDGRLLSRRWRPVAWLAAVSTFGIAYHQAFSAGRLGNVSLSNPFALDGLGGQLAEASAICFVLLPIAFLASLASLVVRLRRAGGDERQQLKWLASGGVVLVIGAGLPVDSMLLTVVGELAIGIAFGTAILRHRLYDIDVVINRALVYTALTATLAGGYLASVLVLQLVLSGVTANNGLAIAASTLAVAALFQPARRRIQAGVDRRFFRSKYDAARTLQRFGARLRDEVDLDALGDELRAVVAETMQPAHVSLWLRETR